MSLTLDQMFTIKAAADYGSFSSAARHLGKAQSTVSATISNFEEEVGIELFERTGRKPKLTKAGEGILEHINLMVTQANKLEGKLNAYAADIEHEVTMLVDSAIPYRFLSPVIKEFYNHFPYVNLHLKSLDVNGAIDHLMDQKYALAVLLTLPNYSEDIAFCRLGHLELAEVAHPEHPLGQKDKVSFEDLGSHRQLVFSPHGHSLNTAEYLRSIQHLYVDDYSTLIQMIRDGLGWSILPRSMVLDYVAKGEMVELLLEPYPHTIWEVYVDLLWNNRMALGPAALWLKQALSKKPLLRSK